LSDYSGLDWRSKAIVQSLKGLVPKGTSEIAEETRLSQRTLNNCLRRLQSGGVVESQLAKRKLSDRELTTQTWRLSERFVAEHGKEIGIKPFKTIVETHLTAELDEEGGSWEEFLRGAASSEDKEGSYGQSYV
jgi:DNA-binding HxlR family transcriptional regulator